MTVHALHPKPTTVDWRADAACFGYDPDLWFADTIRGAKQIAQIALDVCATCPVRDACLQDALAIGDQGIRGGTTTKQRAADGGMPSRWDQRRIDQVAGIVLEDLLDGLGGYAIADGLGISRESLWRALERGGYPELSAQVRWGRDAVA